MARREINVFSVSFLDCIFCGFGAVVLLFVIINARERTDHSQQDKGQSAEEALLQRELFEGQKDLIVVRNSLETTEEEAVRTEGLSREVLKLLEETREQLARYEHSTLAKEEHINKLKSDLASLEEDYKRLKAAASASAEGGNKVKSFSGSGDRQYLTGVKMGGKRILVLLDASASMLGRQVVDVIIRRNLSDATKKASPKWKQAVATVDWMTSQFPAGSRFQIYTFNETATPLLPSAAGRWMDASDPALLGDVMTALRDVVPRNGTSLHRALNVIEEMETPPDNLFLLIDSLPTMGERKGLGKKISAKKRLRHAKSAIKKLPSGLPVNVILFPMEGDPMASSMYWRVAVRSRGSFFSPSEDWP